MHREFTISQNMDPYQPTSIMECNEAFFLGSVGLVKRPS